MNWTVTLWTLLAGAAWKGTLVLTGGWIVAMALRQRSAATRHVVWVGTLAALLLLPLLAAFAPGWSTPATFRIVADASAVGRATAPASAVPILVGLWAIVAALLLARLAVANMRMAWLVRQARVAGNGLVETTEAGSPMAWGFLRPVILIPQAWHSWTDEERRRATLHEQAHIQRYDCATLLVARIATALYWFHPLAWLAAGRALDESEHACDDAVLNASAAPADYADQLIQLARTSRAVPAAAVAMIRPSQLERRIRAILQEHADRRGVGRRTVLAAIAALVVVAAPLATLRAQEEAHRVGDGVSAPVVTKQVPPQYDPDAKAEKVQGTVLLKVVISSKGLVDNAEVVRSLDPRLDLKAIEAVQQWEFKPGMLDGKPVAVIAQIEINFKLL